MQRLLLGTMRVAPRSHRILRGKSIAESALYLGTHSVGLSLMTKDDALSFANFPIQSFMSCTVMTWWFSLWPTASDDQTTGANAPQINRRDDSERF